ncbi:zinc finger protein 16-like [Cloeon dipterum]|uniref:zinc finger protein 16-like n=1 Tax=Cloeon dipterum TaxID=197152 RepID=UPI00321F75B9
MDNADGHPVEDTAPAAVFHTNGIIREIIPLDRVVGDFEFVSVPSATSGTMEPEEFDPLSVTSSSEPVVPTKKMKMSQTFVLGPGGVLRNMHPSDPSMQRQVLIPAGSLLRLVPPTSSQPPNASTGVKKEAEEGSLDESGLKVKLQRLPRKTANTNECWHCNTKVANLVRHLENEECFTPIVKCSYCQRIFTSEHKYDDHFENCSEKRIFCEVCNKTFLSGFLFTYHWYHTHTEQIPKDSGNCQHCNGWCQMLVGVKKPRCAICSSTYSSRAGLMRHVYESHLKTDFLIARIFRKRLTCQLCFNNFGTVAEMINHYLRMDCNFRRCEICSAVFKDQTKLVQHVYMCHNNSSVVREPGNYHECKNCNPQPVACTTQIITVKAEKTNLD